MCIILPQVFVHAKMLSSWLKSKLLFGLANFDPTNALRTLQVIIGFRHVAWHNELAISCRELPRCISSSRSVKVFPYLGRKCKSSYAYSFTTLPISLCWNEKNVLRVAISARIKVVELPGWMGGNLAEDHSPSQTKGSLWSNKVLRCNYMFWACSQIFHFIHQLLYHHLSLRLLSRSRLTSTPTLQDHNVLYPEIHPAFFFFTLAVYCICHSSPRLPSWPTHNFRCEMGKEGLRRH